MFTLKLYQNGPLPPEGRTVILETAGLWVDECGYGVKHVRAFRKEVGVMDEGGTPEFYVGGDIDALRRELFKSKGPAAPVGSVAPVEVVFETDDDNSPIGPATAPASPVCGLLEANGFKIPGGAEPLQIESGRGGNYFTWGVLENAQGKTTQMFR